MPLPHLIAICGPPGTGKTTLAHALALLVDTNNGYVPGLDVIAQFALERR